MKLHFDEIKKILFGALYTEEKDGLFIAHRFETWQEELFDQTLDYINKPLKTKATASMQLDFYTDAKRLTLSYQTVLGSGSNACFTDVYVDGIMRAHEGYFSQEERAEQIDLDLTPYGTGKKRVTVYLPNLFGMRIRSMVLAEASVVEPAQKSCKLLAVGDSITQGYTAVFPSLSYVNVLGRLLNADVLNQGIGGARFEACDIERGVSFAPDLITVAYGTNDWSRGRDIETNARAYLKALTALYPTTPVYVILPLWRGDVAKKELAIIPFEETHVILRRVCEGFPTITVVDGREIVPHFPEFFMPDTLHPNDLGFVLYGENLYRKIAKN